MTESEDNDASAKQKAYAALATIREAIVESTKVLPQPLGEQMREVLEFRMSLSSETDRGSALMAAAFLDDRLKSLLEARLVDDKKLSRRAFEFNGSLGTFSSRIDFSYLLGLIPKNAHRDLHIVRSIRNKFAHVAAPIGFDHPDIKPLCDNLIFHGVAKGTGPGAKYRRSVMGLLTVVLTSTLKTEHIAAASEMTVPDTSESYQVVAAMWKEVSGGLPYPVENPHADAESAPVSDAKSQ